MATSSSFNPFSAINGKKLEYILYVEGVKLPFSSFSWHSTENIGAGVTFDLLPLYQATKFTRGMLVHLFKREGTDAPLLRFFGLLTNIIYEKNDNRRTLRMEANSLDCRWETMAFAEFDTKGICAAANYMQVLTTPDGKECPTATLTAAVSASLIDATAVRAGGTAAFRRNELPIEITALVGANWGMNVIGDFITIPAISTVNAEVKALLASSLADIRLQNPTCLSDRFMNNIYASGGNVLAGLITTINSAYVESNAYNQLEFSRTKAAQALVGMSVAMPTFEENIFQVPVAVGTTDPQQRTRYGLLEVLDQVTSNAGGPTRLKSIVTEMLNTTFCQYSVDPTQMVGSIIFHPIMLGLFPPRCNVLFPNQINTISYNPNMWSDPTRSLVTFPSKLTAALPHLTRDIMSNRAVARTFLCDSENPDLSMAALTTLANEPNSDVIAAQFLKMTKLLTDEETRKGVYCKYTSISSPVLERLGPTAASYTANFMHYMAKYGTRSCHVTGALFDDVVVGMPILIIDGVFSIVGLLSHVEYSVDTNGALASDLVISCPALIYADQRIPDPLLWLKLEGLAPEKIANIYQGMFGCGSIYDPSLKGNIPEAPHGTLLASVDKLRDDFKSSTNRPLFVDRYRKRSFLTEIEVFEGQHKAHAVTEMQEGNNVTVWQGDDFASYRIGYAEQLASPTDKSKGDFQHKQVDKQAIVLDFLREYYKKPGRFE